LWLARGLPLFSSGLVASLALALSSIPLRVWDDAEKRALQQLLHGRRPDPKSLA
jgi:hypothetical protein